MKTQDTDHLETEIREALQRGTERAANAAPALWQRLKSAEARPARRRWILPTALTTATVAAAAVALLVLLPPLANSPTDVVSPPAAAASQSAESATTAAAEATPGKGDLVKQFEQLQSSGATAGQLLDFLREKLPGAEADETVTLAGRYIDLVESRITIHMNYEDNYSSRLAKIALSSDAAMDALIDLRGKTELGDLAGKFSAEDRAFLEEMLKAGCVVDFADGMPHSDVRYRWLLEKVFTGPVGDELVYYLTFSATEAEKPYALEGMLEILPVELAARWETAVGYLKEWPDASEVRREKADTYRQLYLAALVTNAGQMFRVEDGTVPNDQKAWLNTLIGDIDKSDLPQIHALLTEYRAKLEAENWRYTKTVYAFLESKGVTLDPEFLVD